MLYPEGRDKEKAKHAVRILILRQLGHLCPKDPSLSAPSSQKDRLYRDFFIHLNRYHQIITIQVPVMVNSFQLLVGQLQFCNGRRSA